MTKTAQRSFNNVLRDKVSRLCQVGSSGYGAVLSAYLRRYQAIRKKNMTVELLNIDCMEYMAGCADNSFDLAITDPPYNVGASNGTFGNKGIYAKRGKRLKHYANHNKTPSANYFDFLFRVSKNQIIWGSNYYPQFLYHSGAIIWDKKLTGSPMSDCEIAFQSFSKLVKKIECEWNGFLKGGEKSIRIHPNQKPIALYKWLLENYAVKGQRILDTHLGSGSSAIAAHYFGVDFVGCEIDKDYYDAACKRFKEETRQLKLFNDNPTHQRTRPVTVFAKKPQKPRQSVPLC